jgi:ribose 5-phosphate isomerase A
VEPLGKVPLPGVIVRFGATAPPRLVEGMAKEAGCEGSIELRTRKDGLPFVTDEGHLILDCNFGRIPEPEVLAFALSRVPGVVEHGLFLGVADLAIVAGPAGIRLIERP